MPSHYEESLQRDRDRINATIREMLKLVLRALTDSLGAFLNADRPRAYLVVLRDQHIDEFEKEIDRLSLEFIIRQQPVASHLRFVYGTIKLNQSLERIGDYCESIARQSLKISHLDLSFLHDRYREMIDLAIPMLSDAVTAFLDKDVELARKAMQSEKAVDNLRTVITAEVARYQQEGRIPVEAIMPLLTIAKRLERTSDQAENICEEVIYLCTGEYAKHKGRDVFRVLFVDEDNACLSQMAEAMGNSLAGTRFMFSSAGLKPAPPDPRAIRVSREEGARRLPPLQQIARADPQPRVLSGGRRFRGECPEPDHAANQVRGVGLDGSGSAPGRLRICGSGQWIPKGLRVH